MDGLTYARSVDTDNKSACVGAELINRKINFRYRFEYPCRHTFSVTLWDSHDLDNLVNRLS